jgi:prevent-host-death family protein
MDTVSMVDFRRDAEAIIRRAQQGKRMILTYRGKPVMRLEPITSNKPTKDDPFYGLGQLADPTGRSLTNEQIDKIIYDQ